MEEITKTVSWGLNLSSCKCKEMKGREWGEAQLQRTSMVPSTKVSTMGMHLSYCLPHLRLKQTSSAWPEPVCEAWKRHRERSQLSPPGRSSAITPSLQSMCSVWLVLLVCMWIFVFCVKTLKGSIISSSTRIIALKNPPTAKSRAQ